MNKESLELKSSVEKLFSSSDSVSQKESYYPTKLEDGFFPEDFAKKIASKREFLTSEIKYPVSKTLDDVNINAKKICNPENILLLPQQQFLKNFYHL